MARTAYGSSQQVRTARGAEYDTFARITSALKAAITSAEKNFAGLVAALHDNRRLWTIIAADVAEKDNGLPQALRAQIFYLAEFTMVHTSRVLGGNGSADVLVEVNTAVMRGLRGEGQAK